MENKGITIRSSQNVNRDMMIVDENGNSVQVAMISGTIQPGKGYSVSISIMKPDIAKNYALEIGSWMDAFITEMRKQAKDSGIPV